MKQTKQLALKLVLALFCLVAVRASDAERQNQGNLRRDDHEREADAHVHTGLQSLLNVQMNMFEIASLQTPISLSEVSETDISSLQFIRRPKVSPSAHRTALEQFIQDQVSQLRSEFTQFKQKQTADRRDVDIKAEMSKLQVFHHQIVLKINFVEQNMGKLNEQNAKQTSQNLQQMQDWALKRIQFLEIAKVEIKNEALIKSQARDKLLNEIDQQRDMISDQYDRCQQSYKTFVFPQVEWAVQKQDLLRLERRIDKFLEDLQKNALYIVSLKALIQDFSKKKASLKEKIEYQENNSKVKGQKRLQIAGQIAKLKRVRQRLIRRQLSEARKMLAMNSTELAQLRANLSAEGKKNFQLTKIPLDLRITLLLEKGASLKKQQGEELATIIKKLQQWNQIVSHQSVNVHMKTNRQIKSVQLYYLGIYDQKQLLRINGELESEIMLLGNSSLLSGELLSEITERYTALMERVQWLRSYSLFQNRRFFGLALDHDKQNLAIQDLKKPNFTFPSHIDPDHDILTPINETKRYFRNRKVSPPQRDPNVGD